MYRYSICILITNSLGRKFLITNLQRNEKKARGRTSEEGSSRNPPGCGSVRLALMQSHSEKKTRLKKGSGLHFHYPPFPADEEGESLAPDIAAVENPCITTGFLSEAQGTDQQRDHRGSKVAASVCLHLLGQ